MTHIITSLCVRDRGCIDVCPVECMIACQPLNEWPWIYIDPDTCIDCGACVPECPVEAIFSEANVPAEWTSFTPLNAERALSGLPTISARLDPLCE